MMYKYGRYKICVVIDAVEDAGHFGACVGEDVADADVAVNRLR